MRETLKKKKLKDEEGITLIALVITIIVLLILAGVAISSITGENGILGRAKDAKTNTENASIEEQVKLAVTDAMLQSSNYKTVESISKLEGALTRHGITDATVTGDEKDGYTVTTKEGKEYKVYSNGTIKEKSIVTEITAENYGDEITGYTANGVSDWKVFYNDGNNVWIMASDYVQLDGELLNYFSVPYGVENQNNNYIYKGDLGMDYSMTNSRIWKNFANEKFAERAMGAPTLEMLISSYNEKHSEKSINYSYDYYDNTSTTGFSFYAYTVSGFLEDDFYYVSSTEKASRYWVAARSSIERYDGDYFVCVNKEGEITGCSYTNDDACGFRPVVCLKSDIKVTKTTSEESTIWNIQ